MLTGLQLP